MPENIKEAVFENLKRYNFWENQGIYFGFERQDYLLQLTPLLGTPLIKVLVGQRRSGKSHIMRQLIGRLIGQGIPPKNIFYFNKEFIEFDSIKTHLDLFELIQLYEKKLSPKGKRYLFIDEVQLIQDWEKLVNSLSQNYQTHYDVWITGSNATLLSGELATLISGRYISCKIFPFSFAEYCNFLKIAPQKQSYIDYLKTGGLPELFHLHSPETQFHYVVALLDSIILKDIVTRHQIKDAHLLEILFKFLCDNIGNLFSIKSIVDYLISQKIKTNFETISNYLHHLKETFIIHEVDRYDIKGKSILAGSKKFYLNDLAFRNFLSSKFDPGLSKALENAIYLHYARQGYKCYVGKIGQEEIDLIIEKGDDKKYIQIAHSITSEIVANREFGNLEKVHDAYDKIVISLDDYPLGNKNGIKHFQAWTL